MERALACFVISRSPVRFRRVAVFDSAALSGTSDDAPPVAAGENSPFAITLLYLLMLSRSTAALFPSGSHLP